MLHCCQPSCYAWKHHLRCALDLLDCVKTATIQLEFLFVGEEEVAGSKIQRVERVRNDDCGGETKKTCDCNTQLPLCHRSEVICLQKELWGWQSRGEIHGSQPCECQRQSWSWCVCGLFHWNSSWMFAVNWEQTAVWSLACSHRRNSCHLSLFLTWRLSHLGPVEGDCCRLQHIVAFAPQQDFIFYFFTNNVIEISDFWPSKENIKKRQQCILLHSLCIWPKDAEMNGRKATNKLQTFSNFSTNSTPVHFSIVSDCPKLWHSASSVSTEGITS